MCNLYSVTKGQAAIREFARAMRDTAGNLQSQPNVHPDYTAPIVRNGTDGERQLVKVRWGLPSPPFVQMKDAKERAKKLEAKSKPFDFKELLRMEPDRRHEYPQSQAQALATMVWDRAPLRGAVHLVQ
jgi:putative SOS response-associated peptidase YedK